LNAAKRAPVRTTLLISPPSGLFGITTILSSKRFSRGLRDAGDVMIIHGTEDQFTSKSTFEALARDGQVRCRAVQGADHFFRDELAVDGLVQLIVHWLSGEA